jgi:hypothetical protein
VLLKKVLIEKMESSAELIESVIRSEHTVGRPPDVMLPFFAYGIFRSNEIAWPRISEFVESFTNSKIDNWVIRLRNGLPILIAQSEGSVDGDCVFFSDSRSAYDTIGRSEPSGEYKWKTIVTRSQVMCNTLVAVKPGRGFTEEPILSWTSAQDPSFLHGMAAVASVVTAERESLLENKPWHDYPEDWDAFFRLQGAFLVLWSIVERFAAFRFGAEYESEATTAKIYALARIPEFQNAILDAKIKDQVVFSVRENKPKRTRKGQDLDVQLADPVTALKTWYQIRSNITHRGKSAKSDNAIVLTSTVDLFNVTYLYLKAVIPSIDREWSKRGVGLLPQIDTGIQLDGMRNG